MWRLYCDFSFWRKQPHGECSALHDRGMWLREVWCLKRAWQQVVRRTFASLNTTKARGSIETLPVLCKQSVNPGHANHCLRWMWFQTVWGVPNPVRHYFTTSPAVSTAVHVSSQRMFDVWNDAPTADVALCVSTVSFSVYFDLCLSVSQTFFFFFLNKLLAS